MINILPIEERKKLIKEYKNRRLVMAGIIVITAMMISLILLASLMGILILRKRSLDASLASQEVGKRFNLPATLDKVTKANRQADIVLVAQKEGFKPAAILGLLNNYLTDQIIVRNIIFTPQDKNQILLIIEGQSATRKSLLDFIERLKNEVAFVEIDSPISNLIREYNNDFKITIKINSEMINNRN
jgi:hypothetical protein